MTTKEIKEAKTAELVAFYNENIDELPTNIRGSRKPVAKFADRKTAERRVTNLVADLKELDAESAAPVKPDDKPATPSTTRSAAIMKSWTNKKTAAKRSQRSHVEVDGVEYRSVRAAFIALGLDLSIHIQFRMLLKEQGKMKDEGRTWKIIPCNY